MNLPSGYRIRPARTGDDRAIAEVQIQVRLTTYRGLVSDAMLDRLPSGLEDRVVKWRSRLEATDGWRTLVVEGPVGGIVGFCYFSREPHERLPEYIGLIDIIYLLKEHQRRGVGEALLRAAGRLLAADGSRTMYLWVHARNDPARRFYEKLGGRTIDQQRIEVHGELRDVVAYGWDEAGFRDLTAA